MGRLYLKRKSIPIASLSNDVIIENSSIGTVIGTFTITGGGSQPYTLSLTDDADGLFTIVGSELRVAGALDYETAIQHQITLRMDDGVNTPRDQIFTILVTDEEEGDIVITQNGITWTITGSPTVGQYWNGDYYVVGACTVVAQTPAWDGAKNGAMVNPTQCAQQGYDSRPSGAQFPYNASLRAVFPLAMSPGDSLISVEGLAVPETGAGAPVLLNAAVLTCVASAPPANSFRPPYFGTTKTLWNQSDVDYGLLPGLAVPPGKTPIPLVNNSRALARVWLDAGPSIWNRCKGVNNGATYGLDGARFVSQLAVHACADIPDAETYANRLIQYGIDLYPISLVNGNGWSRNGGHGWGRKWPILFAGIMLDDNDMKAPPYYVTGASGELKFEEDAYTYEGVSSELWGEDCAVTIGDSSQSQNSCRDPAGLLDNIDLPSPAGAYQVSTSSSIIGTRLAVHLMGADALWGHDPYLDYCDRWTTMTSYWPSSGTTGKNDYHGYGGVSSGTGVGFMMAMWQTYRGA